MSRPLPAAVQASLIALALLVVPACSQGEATPESATASVTALATTSTTEATTTTTMASARPKTPEEQVESAYVEAARVLDEAFATSDADHPGLALTRLDPNLATMRQRLRERRAAGQAVIYRDNKPPVQVVQQVSVVDDTHAVVTVCVLDNSILVDSGTGAPLDETTVSRLNHVQMRLIGERWKVVRVEEPELAAGLGGCK